MQTKRMECDDQILFTTWQQHKRLSHFHLAFLSSGICVFLCFFSLITSAQSITDSIPALQDSSELPLPLAKQRDFSDVFRAIFHTKPKKESTSLSKPSFALLPVLGYNPSFGFVLGAKVNIGKQLGDPANTAYSIYSFTAFTSSKGITTLQARHNVFTPENKWNYQGNWQLSRFGLVDYGLGVENIEGNQGIFDVGQFPTTNPDSAFPMKYKYIRLNEKIFRNIGPGFYAGAGVSFDIYNSIEDFKLDSMPNTPHHDYSISHGFDLTHYSANGLFLTFQYNTRDHPLRAYKGIYAEIAFRLNQKWMGSSDQSTQFQYDLRKYWSLSKKNPEHVIALWLWGSYRLGGTIPYLELPNTASDVYNRVGEAYPLGRFRGPSYAFVETDYRFPITRNKFISGVVFVNVQSASDGAETKLYEAWALGEGFGLRFLFDKKSRTTLCVDFAKGNYGSSGIYSGLGEIF
jgi:hypothetical protein